MNFNIKSPAKINIGLRVLSKRADGYHNIETIFYPVKIYDEIHLRVNKLQDSKVNRISVKSSREYLNNKNNICYKAVELFLKEFGIKNGYRIDIKITKEIPVGAGLGGGSSDAASVLKILSNYFGILPPDKIIRGLQAAQNGRLKSIALELGSDVPFFSIGKPAYATSRGEKLTIVPGFKIRYKVLIVNPGIHISTKEAYEGLRIAERRLRDKQLNKFKKFNLKDKDKYVNDFESAVFKKYPAVRKIKEKMYEFGSVFSLMSGSGSTVYGFFTPGKIKAAEKFFRSLNYKVFIS